MLGPWRNPFADGPSSMAIHEGWEADILIDQTKHVTRDGTEERGSCVMNPLIPTTESA